MQTLFENSSCFLPEIFHSYGEVVRKEFYDGDVDPIAIGEPFGVSMAKALEYPISLIQITNRARIGFRRAWHHIRADRIGVRTIWFVRRGTAEIVRPDSVLIVKPGESAIVDSNVPFRMRALGDEQALHQSIQAIVPAHLFLSLLPDAIDYRGAFSLTHGTGLSVSKLLDFLCSDGDRLSGSAAEPLVTSLLTLIGDAIRQKPESRRRQTCSDRRFSEIESYVMRHLTDPELSFYKVASNCGVSPRYLSYLLKDGNTTFSDLLWGRRLAKATEWLLSAAMRDRMVQEIAFMAGFKSAAHFSRMFKAHHGCSPKEFRASRSSTPMQPAETLFAAGDGSTD